MRLRRKKPDALQGTLDLLVLKILSRGPHHGYGIAADIESISDDILRVEEGSLYPALRRTIAGVVVGAVAAFETTRLLGYLLYDVSPVDPLVFSGAVAIVVAAAGAACVIPALRAARTDPLQALR